MLESLRNRMARGGGASDEDARRAPAHMSASRSIAAGVRGFVGGPIMHMLVVAALVLVRQLMCHWLPCQVLAYAYYDDNLMVAMARSILEGQWLGAYGQLTLVKGVGFPLFLVFAHVLGVSYLDLVVFLYSVSCVVFVRAVRELLPRSWQRLLLLCVLLFAPVIASATAVQRVYRCSITPALVLLVFASLVRLFLLATDAGRGGRSGGHDAASGERQPGIPLGRMAAWAVLGGVSLAWLWNTREDGVWVVPAAGLLFLCTIVACVRHDGPVWRRAVAMALAVVPFAMLLLSSTAIAATNAQWYQQDLVLELSGGNFPRAIKALYAIAPEEGEKDYGPRVTVTDQIMARAIEASPTLKTIEPTLWERWNYWKQFGGKPEGQPKNGWFFWGFRDAVSEAGLHSSARVSEAFYGSVAEELTAAMQKGELTERPTMPSALMPPYKEGYLDDLVRTAIRLVVYVARSEGTQPALVQTETWAEGVEDDVAFLGARVIPVGGDPTERMRASVAACDAVKKAYGIVSPALGVVGLAGFVALLVALLRSLKRGHARADEADANPAVIARDDASLVLPLVIVQTVLLIAFLTLIAGLAYTEVFSFDAVNPTYASGAYPLYLSFGVLGVPALWSVIRSRG